MTKYIILFLAVGVLVFGTLNYFNLKSKRNFKEITKGLQNDTIRKNAEIKDLTIENFNLRNSKQKVDTVVKIIKGKTIYVYRDIPTESIDSVKVLNDSLKNDDLALQWQIKYSGIIFEFNPAWQIKQKTITINNIVKEPYPVRVEIEVPINKRAFYLGGQIGNQQQQFNIYIGGIYTTKQRTAFNFNMSPIDRSWTGGVFYKLF